VTSGRASNASAKDDVLFVVAAEVVVVASVTSVLVRTHFGEQPDQLGVDDAVAICILAVPALLGAALTTGRFLRKIACALAVATWLPFGLVGDLSGTDDFLAFAIPLVLAVPQLVLMLLSWLALWRRGRAARRAFTP
jgi:hypothetical protein